jgi:hypothetical protein
MVYSSDYSSGLGGAPIESFENRGDNGDNGDNGIDCDMDTSDFSLSQLTEYGTKCSGDDGGDDGDDGGEPFVGHSKDKIDCKKLEKIKGSMTIKQHNEYKAHCEGKTTKPSTTSADGGDDGEDETDDSDDSDSDEPEKTERFVGDTIEGFVGNNDKINLHFVLKCVLFACLFFIVAHDDTRNYLVKMFKVKKEHYTYIGTLIFFVVYFILNMIL